ncbi:hypothetical protein BVI2075_970048 [Burkholderia vietnamiensis]|nr:hypothetical protein BVI2075_970048 [Burkholderia vietnamiensis]
MVALRIVHNDAIAKTNEAIRITYAISIGTIKDDDNAGLLGGNGTLGHSINHRDKGPAPRPMQACADQIPWISSPRSFWN